MTNPLPRGWSLARLGDICLPISTVMPGDDPDCEITYIDISSIDRSLKRIADPKILRGRDAPSRARQLVRAGDILVSTVRPNLQAIAIVPPELDEAVASTGFCVLRPSAEVNPQYLFRFVLSDGFLSRIVAKARGVSYPAVRDNDIREEHIPVPPRSEQDRIVGRMDALFSELDHGLAELRNARDRVAGFERSAMRNALTGWVDNGSHAWPTRLLGDVTVTVTSGSRDWKPYYGRGAGVFILAQNVRNRRLDLSTRLNVDPPDQDSARTRSAVQRGDILVTIVGAGTGTAARVPEDLPDHWVCQSVALIRPAKELNPEFLEIFMTAADGGRPYLEEKMYGQGRPHLSFADIKAMPVPVPDLATQARVVEEARRGIAACLDAVRYLSSAQDEATRLRRAILGDGLTGRLTPQDAADEPSSMLLKRIHDNQRDPRQPANRRHASTGKKSS